MHITATYLQQKGLRVGQINPVSTISTI